MALTVQGSQSKGSKMSFSQQELEALVQKTIALLNRVRVPEVMAKSIFVSPALITISFSGDFCFGCGVFDIVDGFTHQFKALTGKAELKAGKTRQINPRTFEADYTLKTKSN